MTRLWGYRWSFITILLVISPILLVINLILDHRANVLIADDWCGVTEVVVAAIDGEITPAHIFEQHNTHRPATLYGLTLLSYHLTRWNRQIDIFFSLFLMLLHFVIIADLFRREGDIWFKAALVVAALLMFSMRLRDVWLWSALWSYLMSWTPILLALWFVRRMQPHWAIVGISLLLVIIATFSLTTGWLGWIILPIVLWIRGYRQRIYYGIWGIASIATIAIYFTNFQTNPLFIRTFCDGYPLNSLVNNTLWERLAGGTRFYMSHLAAPFIPGRSEEIPTALPIGLLLVIFASLNIIFWLRHWRKKSTWIGLSSLIGIMLYALSASAITLFGRIGNIVVFNSGYHLHVVIFWAVFFALSMSTTRTMFIQNIRGFRWLGYFNIIVFILLVGLYFNANIQAADFKLFPPDYPPYTHLDSVAEDCLVSTPFKGLDCLYTNTYPPFGEENVAYYVQRLAEARVHAFVEATAMLPSSYQQGTPVIIAAEQAQQHPIIGYYTSTGEIKIIPEIDIYHVVDPTHVEIVSRVATSSKNVFTIEQLPLLQEKIADQEMVWLLAMDDIVGTATLQRLEPFTVDTINETWWRRQFDIVASVKLK